MAVQVLIDSIDRTKRIDWQSLKIQNVLTSRIDRCSFIIETYGDTTYRPNLGHEVIIYRDATKIFGGLILSIEEAPEAYNIIGYKIECVDYTRLLDGKLVTEVYENMTINAIIADLIANWAPTGFTGVNVDCPNTINYIAFNYVPLSKCLKELAERFNYDWYVDYDKDIHFFNKEENAAPFSLNDNDGSYIFPTLQINRDNSQVKNVIIVRGGEYLADTLTAEIQTNGVDYMFNLPYRYEDFQATLSSTNLNVGIDFSSDPDLHDALWNRDEKVLKFKKTDTPSNAKLLKIIGRPYLPVIIKQKDNVSVEAMISAEGGNGEYEYLIIDQTINSKEGARQRAAAELYAYSQTISEADFETEVDGLKSGQRLHVVSAARDLDEYYIINKVNIRMRTADQFYYHVSLVTTRTFGMIEMLQNLILDKTKEVNLRKKEILDLIESFPEIITIDDGTPTLSKVHNPQSEAMSFAETLTVQSLNYDVDFYFKISGQRIFTA